MYRAFPQYAILTRTVGNTGVTNDISDIPFGSKPWLNGLVTPVFTCYFLSK